MSSVCSMFCTVGFACFCIGCTEHISKYDAEQLIKNAGLFEPFLCETPLRLHYGTPTHWGSEKAADSSDAGRCIDFARTEHFITWGFVWHGDPDISPSCMDPKIPIIQAVPGKSAIVDGRLFLDCGSSRIEIIHITYEGPIANIYFREFRVPSPLATSTHSPCPMVAPRETWRDHVIDVYYSRGKWHLGTMWP